MAFTTTNFGISYDDWWEGPNISVNPDGGEVVRPCILAWSDQKTFIKAMLGYTEWLGGVTLTRSLPEYHPDYFWMYASSCSLRKGIGKPLAGVNGAVTFDSPGGAAGSGMCIIDVVYRAPEYEVMTDEQIQDTDPKEIARFVTRSESYATESVTVPGGGFKFTSDNVTIQEPSSKLFYTKSLKYTWHQVPTVGTGWLMPHTLQTNIETCLGKVNAATFDTRYTTAESVLFLGPEIRRTRMSNGDPAMDIDYNFLVRPAGWNLLWRAGSVNAFAAITPIGGAKLYPTADLNSLFELA